MSDAAAEATPVAPVDATAPAAPVEATPEAVAAPKVPPKSKQELYGQLAQTANDKVAAAFAPVQARVKERAKLEINLRRVFGDDDGRRMVVDVIRGLLLLTIQPNAEGKIKEGYTVGLPDGLGSLEILTAGATTKTTPQGVKIPVERRWRLKWNPGKSAEDMLDKLPKPPQDVDPNVAVEVTVPVEAAAPAEAPAAAPAPTA
jgi:hypothetical protein